MSKRLLTVYSDTQKLYRKGWDATDVNDTTLASYYGSIYWASDDTDDSQLVTSEACSGTDMSEFAAKVQRESEIDGLH